MTSVPPPMFARTSILLLGLAALVASGAAAANPMPPRDSRARLGIMLLEPTPELRRHLGGPAESGVLVARVLPGSPAEGAGVRVGDLLIEADQRPIGSVDELIGAVGSARAGGELRLLVVRDRRTIELAAAIDGDSARGWQRRAGPSGPYQLERWLGPRDGAGPGGPRDRLGDDLGDKLDVILDRLDALERRFDRIERRR